MKNYCGLKPHDVSKKGISRTFQNIRLFNEMSVIENVLVGMHTHLKAGLMGILFNLPAFRKEEKASEMKAYRFIGICRIWLIY